MRQRLIRDRLIRRREYGRRRLCADRRRQRGRSGSRPDDVAVKDSTYTVSRRVRRNYIGNYCTSLDMAGVSITLSRLDPEIGELLAAPAEIAIRTF